MRGIFLMVCNMSVTAVFVIVLVLLARQLLVKAPRSFSYYLWILVAIRLICPYSFSSAVSIFNLDLFRGYMAGNQVMWTGQEELSELLSFGGSGEEDKAADGQAVREADRMRGTESMSGAESGAESTPETEEAAGIKNMSGAEGETASLTDGGPGWGGTGIEVLTSLWLLEIKAMIDSHKE